MDLDFEKVYVDHHRRVYSICLRILKDQSEAEDLTQETFIQIARKLHTFRGDSALSTWIHRITVNQVLMYVRKRRLPTVELDEAVFSIPAHSIDPLVPLLPWAVKQLPDGYKEHILLHDYLGYDHGEVARLLNVSVGTVKSQVSKARAKMRRLLNKKCNPRVLSR